MENDVCILSVLHECQDLLHYTLCPTTNSKLCIIQRCSWLLKLPS